MSYDNWNDWYQAEKSKVSKEYSDFVIHPAGMEGEEEWLKTGRENFEYTVDEIKLEENETVLEYGCGNGRILRHFVNYKSYGVDIVPDFVEEARDLGCDAYLLEDFNLKVDKVFSLTVFIHLRKSQAMKALKYIHNHLVEGGEAHIQALIYEKDKDALNFSDMTCYKEETFMAMADLAGFEIAQLYTNKGDIDKEQYGPNHNKYQVLIKK